MSAPVERRGERRKVTDSRRVGRYDTRKTDRRQPVEGVTLTAGDCIGGFPYAELNCRGCGKPLSIDNAWMTDGCPCNTPLGVNSMNETRWRLLMMLQQREARYTESLERAGDALKAAGDKLLAENAALRGLQGPTPEEVAIADDVINGGHDPRFVSDSVATLARAILRLSAQRAR